MVTTLKLNLDLLDKPDPSKTLMYEARKNIVVAGPTDITDERFEGYVCSVPSGWRAVEGDRVYLKFSKRKRTIVEG